MNKRWKMTVHPDRLKTTFTPDAEEMSKWVIESGRQLTEKIMEHEEKLVLTTVSDAGLKRLIHLCEAELLRRHVAL